MQKSTVTAAKILGVVCLASAFLVLVPVHKFISSGKSIHLILASSDTVELDVAQQTTALAVTEGNNGVGNNTLMASSSTESKNATSGNNTSITRPAVEGSNRSTCSIKSADRGPGQRVVSFSFYGSGNGARPYFKGIDGNADAVRRIYPGWIMRLYHEVKETDSVLWGLLHDLEIKYPHLDLCNISCLPALGNIQGSEQMSWRFLPMEDPFVDVYISRDLDSRTPPREKAAVDDWLSTNITFHTMRDHPKHLVQMLGGMWGARMDLERELVQNVSSRIRIASRKAVGRGRDQYILRKVLWPVIKGNVVQHDSYSCKRFSSHGNMRPWPTRRTKEFYNFVGFRDQVDKKPVTNKCPLPCRPPAHRDWVTC